eukprot:TRINITY_DN12569_c0_g1_i1.p1 TRINITY_DN12569_c0_g1~~TRINITY_DN12569_c0_g1_i1.p1  ORF type:complete len:302 (-),score=45.02 TRINITY_DN12569_c0_g1_i1:54-959(-)
MSAMSPKSGLTPLEQSLSGLAAGACSTLVTHPLDMIKTRIQVQAGGAFNYKGTIDALKNVFLKEHKLALYQGLTPNITGNALAWGLYFYFYSTIKSFVSGTEKKELSPTAHFLSGLCAGAITSTITNPIWVVKTRMIIQVKGQPSNYRGFLHGIYSLWKEEGRLGLFRGWVPAMFGTSHGAAQFMAYEEIRKYWSAYQIKRYGEDRMSTIHFLTMGSLSKVFASVVTYPYQVVRSRLQERPPKYEGVVDCCVRSWKRGGVKEFYAGLVPNILRTIPQSAIIFVAYEHITQIFTFVHSVGHN